MNDFLYFGQEKSITETSLNNLHAGETTRESCKFFDTDETSRLILFDKFYQFRDNLILFNLNM